MLEFFVLICLCGYTYASVDFVKSTTLRCSYHIKYESASNPEYSGHYYGLVSETSVPTFARFVGDNGGGYLLRCDDRDEYGRCYLRQENAACSDTYVMREDYNPPFYGTRIPYEEDEYPQPAECPDSSMTGCQKYCFVSSHPLECVIVNSMGYVVQDVYGSNYTFYDDITMDVFAGTKCDGKTNFPAPSNFCETMVEYIPPELGCSYHYKLIDPAVDFYAVIDLQNPKNFLYVKRTISTGTVVVNCDERNGKLCYTKVTDASGCNDQAYTDPGYYYLIPPERAYYDSAEYPKPSNCPDGSAGCFKYCKDITEIECFIVDADGHIVKSIDGQLWEYFDPPSMDVFEVVKCDGATTLPAPVDGCAEAEIFKPKIPDCSFNISIEQDMSMNAKIRDDVDICNVYGVKVNGKPILGKVKCNRYLEYFRCDLTNNKDLCFHQYQFNGICNENYDILPFRFMESLSSSYFPLSLMYYNKTAYPQTVTCPGDVGGSDDCKAYCDFNDYCVFVNSTGFVLGDSSRTNWTYSNELSFDVFEVDTCESPSTHIPAPTTDYCGGGQSSGSSSTPSSTISTISATSSSTISTISATSSSTTSSPQTPSSIPVVSSASMVKSAFTFVALAMALL